MYKTEAKLVLIQVDCYKFKILIIILMVTIKKNSKNTEKKRESKYYNTKINRTQNKAVMLKLRNKKDIRHTERK